MTTPQKIPTEPLRMDPMRLIRAAWTVYTTQFGTILLFAVVVYTPIFALIEWLGRYWHIDALLADPDRFSSNPAAFVSYLATVAAISTGFGVIVTNAVIIRVHQTIVGRLTGIRAVVVQALWLWIPALMVTIIMWLGISILSVLLIIPGLLAWIYWIFVHQAVVLANQRHINALRYSFRLVRGHWFELCASTVAVSGAVAVLIYALNSLVVDAMIYPGIETITGVISQVISLFVVVFMTVYFHYLQAADALRGELDMTKQPAEPVASAPTTPIENN